jgi:hypothetical protein
MLPRGGYRGGQPPSAGLAVTSMVLGIVGVVGTLFSCCCGVFAFVGVILGIGAVITGVIALNKCKDGSGEGRGMAIAGVSCGAASIVLGIALVVLAIVFSFSPGMMQQFQQMQNR